MHAVFVTGGKQYRVKEGDTLKVEKLEAAEGATIDFEQVLLVHNGDDIRVGAPYVDGGKISAKVKSHGRGKKVHIIKFKRRKHYMRRAGHRQSYTELEISAIQPGSAG